MEHFYEGGYKMIQWVQTFQHPFLDWFFVGASALGVGGFYFLAIPIVTWCVDKSLGARLCFLFLLGFFFNTWIKYFFHMPRPDATRVRVLFAQSGSSYSYPSGHAQGSAAFWGYCMTQVKKTWFRLCSMALITAMCVSRLYLGLHFPWDVLGGLLLGVGSLIFFFVLLALYEKMKSRVPWYGWLTMTVLCTVTLAMLFPQKRFGIILGSFLGFFCGAVVEKRFVGFRVQKGLRAQVVKLALGLGVGALLLFPSASGLIAWGRAPFLTHALAGFWVSFLAPWCFKKLDIG